MIDSEPCGKIAAFIRAHFAGLLIVILVVGIAARFAALLAFKDTPYFDFLMMDERIYHDWAVKIISGTYTPAAAYEFPPLPAYITALVYKLFSPDPLYIRYLNIAFGTATCLFIGLTGKELDAEATALLAALIAALYKPFILYSAVPLKTALSVFLCSVVVYLTALFSNRPTWFQSFLLGLFTALALNVRGNYLAFIPILAAAVVLVYWKKRRSVKRLCIGIALYASGLCVVVAPFAIRNHAVTGDWVLSTTQAGFNFYLGNNLANAEHYSRPVSFAASSPILQGVQFTIEASRRSGKTLTAGEASWFWTKQVFQQAVRKPSMFMCKLVGKALAGVNRHEACDHYSIPFLSTFMPYFKLPFFSFLLIMPLGFAGMLIETLRSKKGGWLATLCAGYFLTLVLFFTNGRYRIPLLTILIPFAALTIYRCAIAIRQHDFKLLFLFFAPFSIFLLLEFVPVKGSADQTAYYNMHGIILENRGDHSAALEFWEASSRMKGSFSPYADLMLAKVNYRNGDHKIAKKYLDHIADDSFAAAYKYDLLGDIHRSELQFSIAAGAYEKSLMINSGQLAVRQKLVKLLLRLDPVLANRQRSILLSLLSYYKGL